MSEPEFNLYSLTKNVKLKARSTAELLTLANKLHNTTNGNIMYWTKDHQCTRLSTSQAIKEIPKDVYFYELD